MNHSLNQLFALTIKQLEELLEVSQTSRDKDRVLGVLEYRRKYG